MASLPMDNKTTQESQTGDRVVFRSERFWKSAAAWSAIVFFLTFGISVLGWSFWMGDDSATGSFVQRTLGLQKLAAAIGSTDQEGQESLPTVPVEPKFRRAIDGAPREASGEFLRHYAVMIDNLDEARPQSGMSQASLVIEAPVEGGVTRFLAVFPEDAAVAKIGPVRSARPYYLDWAAEFDALYAHVGGSPEALELLARGGIKDFNEYSNGDNFWRDKARYAPHNVYTSTEQLRLGHERRFPNKLSTGVSAWAFAEPSVEPTETVPDLVIDLSRPTYKVEWKYDAEQKAYRRYQGGKEQRDADGSPILAKNIAVQFTSVKILDEVGRRQVTTIGSGKAVLARAGRVTTGTWEKQARKERTTFYGVDGDELVFTPGQTWIEVVPNGATVSY